MGQGNLAELYQRRIGSRLLIQISGSSTLAGEFFLVIPTSASTTTWSALATTPAIWSLLAAESLTSGSLICNDRIMTQHSSAQTTDRLLILPSDEDRRGTRYDQAHRVTEQLAHEHGIPRVEQAEGTATLLVIVQTISPTTLRTALEQNPHLRWVQFPFAGIEPLLPVIRQAPEITYTSAAGSYAPPVAEHGLALTLALLRHLPERLRATSWGQPKGTTLDGCHIAIIGGGGIGRELVRLFSTWDTKITVVRRTEAEVPGAYRTLTQQHLHEAITDADVVVLAAAATDQTAGMFSAREFAVMKPSAVLVNVARGSLVVTDDLLKALTTGEISAAGLDVTDPEPLPDGHPLWSTPNVIITPHSADTAEMCIPLLDERIQHNLIEALRHRDLAEADLQGRVDLDAGY